MKRLKNALVVLVVISFTWSASGGLSYAQPDIPKEKIPSDINSDVGKQIERLYSSDPVERGRGAHKLGKMGAKVVPAIPFLIGMLKDKDSEVRQKTAWALGEIKDPRAIEPLIATIRDENLFVQLESARALGRIGDPVLQTLIAIIKDEKSDIRWEAGWALGQIRDPRAVEPLITALKDENSFIREWVIKALGDIKDPRAVEPLIAALKDKYDAVRRNAAEALGKITEKDFGEDPTKWQEWWEKNKEKFQK